VNRRIIGDNGMDRELGRCMKRWKLGLDLGQSRRCLSLLERRSRQGPLRRRRSSRGRATKQIGDGSST
jgi:hypothetical protein